MSFVITGNPGVGKHTISKEISKLVQLPIIDINKIAQEFGLFEKNKETNDVDVTKLGEIIRENFSHPVLFVGHLAPYVLSPDKIKKVIVLRKNPYNLISIYKHNSVLLKKEGDHVRAGDPIGISGSSGELSSGPHLHFELWYNGTPINPEEYIIFN